VGAVEKARRTAEFSGGVSETETKNAEAQRLLAIKV